jgi:hypothetical protein
MDHDTAAHETYQTSRHALAEGYRQMTADIEHEMEAEEWAEALIGDTFGTIQEPVKSPCSR